LFTVLILLLTASLAVAHGTHEECEAHCNGYRLCYADCRASQTRTACLMDVFNCLARCNTEANGATTKDTVTGGTSACHQQCGRQVDICNRD